MTSNSLKRPVSNAGCSNVVNVDEPSRKRDKVAQKNDDSSDDEWFMPSSSTTDSLQPGSLWDITAQDATAILPPLQGCIGIAQHSVHWNEMIVDDQSNLYSVAAIDTSMEETISHVESGLNALKVLRLEEFRQSVYIPPIAKPNLQVKDEDAFSLMDNVQKFLSSNRQVMLILGDSGAGKSTFNRHLEHHLWTNYKEDDPIPLFINLPTIVQPSQDMIGKQLMAHDFSDDQIVEMKLRRQFILICDGYDESQLTGNLHTTNRLNQKGQWRTKMIISCRTQFLGPVYRHRFVPQPADRYTEDRSDLFQEAVIAPFSKTQVEDYVARYVPLEPRPWVTEDYMRMLTTIPNLMDLVKNPFLLTLTLEALPGVTKDQHDLSNIRITRVQLYDHFVDEWFGVNMRRLRNNTLNNDERVILERMFEKGFVFLGVDYSKRLALAIFDKHEGNPVVQYLHYDHKNTWKADFFESQPEVRFLRESSPLTRTGSLHRFIHRSILEYFFSRTVFDPVTHKVDNAFYPQPDNNPLFTRSLLKESSIVQFLCERVKQSPAFEKQLQAVIELSKGDTRAATAAANAITILVRAGVRYNGADLRGIRIPGADLSGGQFDCVQFQGADLRQVNLARTWLRQADFRQARMEGIQFGELPYLKTASGVNACTYSPDGKCLALVLEDGSICIYDTITWTRTRHLKAATDTYCLAFSPDSSQFVTGSTDSTARLWDCASGSVLFVMQGHTRHLKSMAFSPCGKRFASAGYVEVRLWNAENGTILFALRGHTSSIEAVVYSPDGRWVVSGSLDGTIRFWDAVLGEQVAVWTAPCGPVRCLAYSSDGLWIGTGHSQGNIQLWNATSGAPSLVLRGHTKAVTRTAFSSNNLLFASSSNDKTVRLWDVLTGALVSVFPGHTGGIKGLSFSPDGLQIASGGRDYIVRLWDVRKSGATPFHSEDVSGTVPIVTYTPDGQQIFTVNTQGVVGQWDALRGVPQAEQHNHALRITSVAFSSDATIFATGSDDGVVQLWNFRTCETGPALREHTASVDCLALSPCGRWAAFAGQDRVVRLWDSHSGELDRRVAHLPSNRRLDDLVFSPSGLHFATASSRFIRTFNRQTMELLTTLRLEALPWETAYMRPGIVKTLTYSPSGEQLAIGTLRGSIYLWNTLSKTPQGALFGGTDQVYCVSYSPCGQWIAAGSGDKSIRLWYLQCIGMVECHSCEAMVQGLFGRVESIAWNPKRDHLEFATGCTDGSIRVWRVVRVEETVRIELVWGSNIGQLFPVEVDIEDAIGLDPSNRDLLRQRGGKSGWSFSDDDDEGRKKEAVIWAVRNGSGREDREDNLSTWDENMREGWTKWRQWSLYGMNGAEEDSMWFVGLDPRVKDEAKLGIERCTTGFLLEDETSVQMPDSIMLEIEHLVSHDPLHDP